MSHEVRQADLREKSQKLFDGPLKHIRGAALAAALLPLASVAVAPASAQTFCASGSICGTVFNDANSNGVFDGGDTPIEGAQVTVCQLCNGTDNTTMDTGPTGQFEFDVPAGTYTVSTLIPTGTQPSPVTSSPSNPSNRGISGGGGFSTVTGVSPSNTSVDFGFEPSAASNPGTGTPGYWKNHPDAWPVPSITVGGVTYTKAQAISWLTKVGKDRTTAMFASLVPAMLNVLIGNDPSCIQGTIDAGNQWMKTYGPVGSGVAGGSAAWAAGDPIHNTLDAYNNGLLCAPHRQ